MILPFEKLNVDVSCLGNHELDDGMETAKRLISQTSCPWLMTNLVDIESKKPILDLKESFIVEKGGLKFGFMGFAEEPWLDALMPDIDTDKM